MFVGICVCMLTCVCACGGQRLISSTLLGHSPLRSLNAVLADLASLASQPALGILPLPPKSGMKSRHKAHTNFDMGQHTGMWTWNSVCMLQMLHPPRHLPAPYYLLLMFLKTSLMQVRDTVVKSREGLLLRASKTPYTFLGGFNILC